MAELYTPPENRCRSGSAATAAMTRQVETTITGSLFTWATYREGTAASWIRRDLDLVLAGAIMAGRAAG